MGRTEREREYIEIERENREIEREKVEWRGRV